LAKTVEVLPINSFVEGVGVEISRLLLGGTKLVSVFRVYVIKKPIWHFHFKRKKERKHVRYDLKTQWPNRFFADRYLQATQTSDAVGTVLCTSLPNP
jgi:hypothetical protein